MPASTSTRKSSTAKKTVAKKAAPRRRTAAPKREHPLKALVPSDRYGDGYVSRTIGGVLDLDVIAAAHKQQHNVALFGPTGVAKTTLIYAYGYRAQLPVVNVPCNGAADPDMLFGGWRPQPDGTFRLMPGPVYYAARYGGVILLDEITFMPPKIAALFYGALDARRVMTVPEYEGAAGCACTNRKTGTCPETADGKHVLPQLDRMGNPIESVFYLHVDCVIASTWNPGYAGTYQLNEALFNRFNHKLQFDYSPDVEEQLIESPTLIELATKLREAARRDGSITTPVSTNSLMELETNAYTEGLGVTYAIENFLAMFTTAERERVRELMANYAEAITTELDGEYTEDEEVVSDDDFEDIGEDDDA